MRAIPVLFLFTLASFSLASDVHGKVTLSNGKPASSCVVFLEGQAHSKPMAHAVLDQRDRRFIPHVLVVTVGTEVAFPNNDTIFHNVFADYDAKRFNLGMYARGQTRHQTFGKPGLVALMCSVHPDMSAYIMVVDTPYHAVADAKGEFSISGVPAGNYKLRVWHESDQILSQSLHVDGDANLSLATHRP